MNTLRKKLTVVKREVQEFNVVFPLYRRHDVGDDYACVFYHRITADEHGKLTQVVLCHRDKQWELEIDQDYQLEGSGLDYLLGLGEYVCTEAEFQTAVREFNSFVVEAGFNGK